MMRDDDFIDDAIRAAVVQTIRERSTQPERIKL